MRICVLQIFASVALACISMDRVATAKDRWSQVTTADKPAFALGGAGYFHRWSQNDQHEFTPRGQDNLEKWSDMITINVYPSAHDGDALAVKANAVLENYKSHGGRGLRTNSIPRTPDRPAEHFIAIIFGRPNFLEAAFARFKLIDGVGCSIVYSHRIYGEKVGDQMSKWVNDNGPKMEKMLMDWNNSPSPASLHDLPQQEARPDSTKASRL